MLMNLLTAVVFLLMFSVLVAVHEWGHYLLARKFNMGVSEFAIGFGPKILKTWKRKKYVLDNGEEQETAFNIRPFPLGGFVKIIGMEPQEDGSEVNINGGFYTRSPWARIVVLLAGPVFSIVFGWLLFVGLFTTIGVEKSVNRISTLSVGGAAEKAGLKPGDTVLQIDNKDVKDMLTSILALRSSTEESVNVKYIHDGKTLSKLIKPTLSKDEIDEIDAKGDPTGVKKRYPILGIAYASDFVPVGFTEAISEATMAPYLAAKMMVTNMLRPKKILEESTGVIGMAVGTRMAVEGGVASVISLAALISISLGFMNLLPIGMLDGGQILLSFIEGVRGGKRLSLRSQLQFLWAGMIVILFFFVAVTYKDLFRFVIPGSQNVLTNRNSSPDSNAPTTNSPSNNAPVK
jgi:regulator of sigma E protease